MLFFLSGSENWLMTEAGGFQGELVKRMLKWQNHHSHTAAIIALDVATINVVQAFGGKVGVPAACGEE